MGESVSCWELPWRERCMDDAQMMLWGGGDGAVWLFFRMVGPGKETAMEGVSAVTRGSNASLPRGGEHCAGHVVWLGDFVRRTPDFLRACYGALVS